MRCKTYTLSQLATIKYGKNQKKVLSDNGGIPIYGTGGLMGYANQSLYDKPSVLIGRKGSIEKVRYVTHPFWTVDTLFYTIINEDLIIPYYLYCAISSIDLKQYNEGTTIPSLRTETLNRLEFNIPPLKTQRKIASILSVLDDKIELNNAINKNLEEQAQALFKSWFVDFEPFGGVMPSGWEIGTVGDISKEVICGKTPPTKVLENYGLDIPFITIPDMHNCTYIIKTERSLSKQGANTQTNKYLQKNSICVSCIGTAGLVSLTSIESQTNQQINSIIPKENLSSYYIFLLMQTKSEIINKLGQSGSTIVNLNKTQFSKMQVLIPSNDIMKSFDEIVEPIFSLILDNQEETQALSTLRDTLLPKLMSGELDVSEIDF